MTSPWLSNWRLRPCVNDLIERIGRGDGSPVSDWRREACDNCVELHKRAGDLSVESLQEHPCREWCTDSLCIRDRDHDGQHQGLDGAEW